MTMMTMMTMMMMMVMMMMMMMLAHSWRPPCGSKWAQGDTAPKLIVIHSQRFRIGAGVDDLWQTVQPGPISEKQAQWLMLQFCPVIFGVTEWIECS